MHTVKSMSNGIYCKVHMVCTFIKQKTTKICYTFLPSAVPKRYPVKGFIETILC
ncbi:hypothetical protein FKM82_023206 [Ascaphus truei]